MIFKVTHACLLSCIIWVWLIATLKTIARKSPLSMFLQARILERIAMPSSRVYIPYPGSEPVSLVSTSLAGGFFTTSTTWESHLRWWVTESCSGLYSPWNSPGQNTGVCILSLLQGLNPGIEPRVSHTAGGFFTSWATREAHLRWWFGPFQGILSSFPVYLPIHIRDTLDNQYVLVVFINLWIWSVGVMISQPKT